MWLPLMRGHLQCWDTLAGNEGCPLKTGTTVVATRFIHQVENNIQEHSRYIFFRNSTSFPLATHPIIFNDHAYCNISITHANVSLQIKIKHTQFKITKMVDIEKVEEHLLATSCDYGRTILLN